MPNWRSRENHLFNVNYFSSVLCNQLLNGEKFEPQYMLLYSIIKKLKHHFDCIINLKVRFEQKQAPCTITRYPLRYTFFEDWELQELIAAQDETNQSSVKMINFASDSPQSRKIRLICFHTALRDSLRLWSYSLKQNISHKASTIFEKVVGIYFQIKHTCYFFQASVSPSLWTEILGALFLADAQ